MHFGTGALGQQYSVTAVPLFLALVLMQIALFTGCASSELDDAVLEWWSRCGAWFGIAATVWLAAGVLVFYMADLIEAGRDAVARQLALGHDTSSAILAIAVPLFSSLVGFMSRTGGPDSAPSSLRVAFQRIALPLTLVLLLGSAPSSERHGATGGRTCLRGSMRMTICACTILRPAGRCT
jgi:hypothetical protein